MMGSKAASSPISERKAPFPIWTLCVNQLIRVKNTFFVHGTRASFFLFTHRGPVAAVTREPLGCRSAGGVHAPRSDVAGEQAPSGGSAVLRAGARLVPGAGPSAQNRMGPAPG